MKKIIIGLLIVTVVGAGFNYYNYFLYKQDYFKAINLIENKEWEKSYELLEKLPENYNNDVLILKKYLQAIINYKNIENNENKNIIYSNVLNNLDEIPSDYNGIFAEQILSFYDKIVRDSKAYLLTELNKCLEEEKYWDAYEYLLYLRNYNYLSDNENKILNNYITALRVKSENDLAGYINLMLLIPDNYNDLLANEIREEKSKAIIELNNNVFELNKNKNYNQLALLMLHAQENNEQCNCLYNFARAMEEKQKGDHSMMIYYLSNIPFNYTGLLEKEINEIMNIYKKEIENDKKIKRNMEIENNKSEPKIGMTKDEVLNSKWGDPEDINKITTKYGTSEQWVYPDYKYIYFEDGKVTAIQE